MSYEVIDESLKRLIKRRAVKTAPGKQDGCFVRYAGRIYYVNFREDRVVLQLERK